LKGLGTFNYSVKVTDANGCITVDDAKVTFFNCTGIDEMADSKIIELYPNPNTGQFAIRSQSLPSGNYELNVYDVRGKLVYSEAELNVQTGLNHPLNLNKLGNGVYVLQVRNSNNTSYNKRFIINR
jgi:hypothetical protein